MLSWQIHNRRYLDRKRFCRALTIWKECMNKVFYYQSCVLFTSNSLTQGKDFSFKSYTIKTFWHQNMSPAHWEILVVKMRCTLRFNTKKQTSCSFFYIFVLPFSRNPMDIFTKRLSLFKKKKIMLNFYQMGILLAKESSIWENSHCFEQVFEIWLLVTISFDKPEGLFK